MANRPGPGYRRGGENRNPNRGPPWGNRTLLWRQQGPRSPGKPSRVPLRPALKCHRNPPQRLGRPVPGRRANPPAPRKRGLVPSWATVLLRGPARGRPHAMGSSSTFFESGPSGDRPVLRLGGARGRERRNRLMGPGPASKPAGGPSNRVT